MNSIVSDYVPYCVRDGLPLLMEDGTHETSVGGWRIFDPIGRKIFEPGGIILSFARESDCQRAIDALAEHGYTTYESMDGVCRNRIRRICTECLAW